MLRRQAGVISRGQARDAGLSEDQIDRRLATGRWLVVHPGVYRPADREFSDEGRVRAVGLWAGEHATISGLAAAWWHRLLPDPPSVVEVTAPLTSGLRPGAGVRLRRRDLLDPDRMATRGLWVTDLPLTVLEAAVALGDEGSRLMDHALQRRVQLAALYQAYNRNLGRRGSTAAGQLLRASADRVASAAERKAMVLLVAAGVTGFRQHHRVNGYEIDLAFPDQRVAVEVDGWAFHHDVNQFQKDRKRQNALVLAGWTVLRFTWHDLTRSPDRVIAEIRGALAVRAIA